MQLIQEVFEQVYSYMFNFGKRTHWLFMITSGVIAFGIYRAQKQRSSSFINYIFNKKVWTGHSAIIDYIFVFFNALVKILLLGSFAIHGLRFAYNVTYYLEVWFGQPISLSSVESTVYFSIIIALSKDFSFFLIHTLYHKVSFLWKIHKVHHSATTLNPFTQYRLHPLELILNNIVSIFVFSLVVGVFDFLSDYSIKEYTILGVGVISFLFLLTGANLRHSHVKLKYPSFLEKILISPYQHQIHHSNNPKHFNKNMGGKFAIWDYMFGTLISSKEVKNVEFGLGKEDKEYDSFIKNILPYWLKKYLFKLK